MELVVESNMHASRTSRTSKTPACGRRSVSKRWQAVAATGTDLEQCDLVILGQHREAGDALRELDHAPRMAGEKRSLKSSRMRFVPSTCWGMGLRGQACGRGKE